MPHDLGSESPTTRRALRELWRGSRLVLVSSPPGAGKTRLVAVVASNLSTRLKMSIVIATPTRSQAVSVASRIGPGADVTLMMSSPPETIPAGVKVERKPRDPAAGEVIVRTVASVVSKPPVCDLLIIDEAYQTTYIDVVAATQKAYAVLMVGDPGQIGPVVTVDEAIFEHHSFQPSPPAPSVLAAHPNVINLVFDSTYRLGAESVSVVRHLYPFSFVSRRPDRWIDGLYETEAISVRSAPNPYDHIAVDKVTQRVRSLIGRTIVEDGHSVAEVTHNDVAVVLSHNAQCAAVSSRLASVGLGDVTVGTADRLQGGEWPCVVALDPLFGYQASSPHSRSSGRLCVMVSRHSHHLSWIGHRDSGEILEADTDMNPVDRAAAIEVRRQLWAF